MELKKQTNLLDHFVTQKKTLPPKVLGKQKNNIGKKLEIKVSDNYEDSKRPSSSSYNLRKRKLDLGESTTYDESRKSFQGLSKNPADTINEETRGFSKVSDAARNSLEKMFMGNENTNFGVIAGKSTPKRYSTRLSNKLESEKKTPVNPTTTSLNEKSLKTGKKSQKASSTEEDDLKSTLGLSTTTLDILSTIAREKQSPIQNTTSSPSKLGLSNSTKLAILKIPSPAKMETRKSTENLAVNKILNKPSVRERFEELLTDKQEYILPFKYKRLMAKFEALDNCLTFLKNKNKLAFFDDIKEMLGIMGTSFSLEDFRRITYVYPSAYALRWDKKDRKKDELELMINFPSDENNTSNFTNLSDRKSVFKNGLLEITKAQHNIFLTNVLKEEGSYGELPDGFWHPRFDVHNIIDIPQNPLPPKPNKLQTIGEFIATPNGKNVLPVNNQTLTKILEELAKKYEEENKLVSKTEYLKESEKILKEQERSEGKRLGLTDKLLDMVREKEKMLLEQKRQKGFINPNVLKKSELKLIADSIKMYYSMRNVSNAFVVKVVDYISSSTQAQLLAKSDILNMIEYLSKKMPDWVQIVNNREGKILRINKETPISKVLKDIDEI